MTAVPGGHRALTVLVKLALTVVILGVTLFFIGVGRIMDAIQRLDLAAWLIAFASFFVVHGLGTFKWRYFMLLSGARVGLRDGLRCYTAGLFANLFLPTMIGGDVLRAGLAMTTMRRKTPVVLGSLVDRLSDLVALIILAVTGFLVAWRPDVLRPGRAEPTSSTPFIVAGALGIAGLVAAAVVWIRWRPKGRIRRILLETLVALRRLRRRFLPALGGLVMSTALQFALLLVHRELGSRIGMPRDLAIWMFVWPLAKIIAMVPISFGGIGVREAAFLGLSKPFGVSEPVAVATSLAWQAVMLVGGLIAGGVWVLLTWKPAQSLPAAERQPT